MKKRLLLFMALCCALLFGAKISFNKTALADSLPNTQAPAGFTINNVVNNLVAPTAAQFAPDGRIFIAQKDGTVKVVKNNLLLPTPFYTVANVNNYVDRGLLGLALDPNFTTNGYVYLLFTYDNNPSNIAGPKTARLIRVTANGDTAVAGSEITLLGSQVGTSVLTSCKDYPITTDCIASDGLSHTVGSIQFGGDNKIYLSVGDAAGYDDVDVAAFNSQNLDSLSGKILRINSDGTAPTDNPFYNGNNLANRSKVYAYGMRNPFRMTIRQSDNLVMSGDVGWNTWEEVNAVPKGANLGWPCYEGLEQQNGTGTPGIGAYKNFTACQEMYQTPPQNLVFPVHIYPHPPSNAVVSGAFYTGTSYPAQYQNAYFFGDYARNQLSTLRLTANNTLEPNSYAPFAFNTGGPVNIFTGPNGDLYYLAINLGAVYHIEYSTTNQAPTAIASANKLSGAIPLSVAFSSGGSFDPEGDTLTYSWDFGDGSPVVQDANPVHDYTVNGSYEVTLIVTDTFNNTGTKSITIYAGRTAPDVTINSPGAVTIASAGDTIAFSGTATDANDGTLTGNQMQWQVSIQHCPLESCHIHNVQTISGTNGTFLFPHHDGPFYIQVSLTATNLSGLSTTKSVAVYPVGQEINHAMLFDGINDYAVAATPQDFRLQQFTAEAYVKTLSTDDWGSEVMSMGNNWSVRVQPDGNVMFSFNANYTWQVLTTTNTAIKDGLWHHVAVTRTTTAMKIYVDGVLVAQNENTNAIDYVYGGEFIIAKHGDNDDHFHFNGAIDEVRIWSQPQTDADIATYHSVKLPADARTNLLALYTAEDGTGTISSDSSVNPVHNLTLMNGPTWTAGVPLATYVANEQTTPIAQLTDDFTATSVDAAKWYVYTPVTNVLQNNNLTITPQANSTGYVGIASVARYSLKNGSAFVQLIANTNSATTAETQFVLEQDTSNNFMIGTTGNSLHTRYRVNGVNNDMFMPYNATTMKWLRIREAAGVITYETSPDNITYTTQRTVTATFSVTQLQVILQAGTYQAIAVPGAAVFDNLNNTAQPNTALAFDGATSVVKASVANQYIYNYQTITIEAWTKVDTTGVWGGEVLSNGNNYGLRILPTGNIRFFTHTGNYIWQDYETTNLTLNDSTWHHIAVSKSATQVKIYVDGVLKQTFESTAAISYTLGKDLVVGSHGDGDTNFNLGGVVDDIRIWNVARTDAEIAANYTLETPNNTTDLMANWHLNDQSGVLALNEVGNIPLHLTGTAAWVVGYPRGN